MSSRRSILLPFLIATSILFGAAVKGTSEIDLSTNLTDANPFAVLRHPSPIAGTNLFLNIPYKWQDNKKIKCYAMGFYTSQNFLGQMDKRLSFVCDRSWYDTENASWLFESVDGSESIDEYTGPVIVRNLGSRETLDTFGANGRYGVLRSVGRARSVKWRLLSDPSNKNNVQLENNGWYLYQKPNYHRTNVALTSGYNLDGYRYTFVPEIKIEAKIHNFVFIRLLPEQVAKHTMKKALLDSHDIDNGSSTAESKTIVVSEKVLGEFFLGLPQSFHSFSKCSGSVMLPIVGDAEVEYDLDFNLSPNQKWKISHERLFSMSYDVNIPSKTNVKVSAWYDRITDIRMNYTAEAEIIGKCTRITVSDEDAPDSPATGAMILNQLQQSQFDGTIVNVEKESVIVQIKGTMVASVGIRGQLDVDGKIVATQLVPK